MRRTIKTRRRAIDIDTFAGGGGASLGWAWATGRSPDVAINHDKAAIKMHAANHPDCFHVLEDVAKVDFRELIGKRHVRGAWFSPDCRHFARAKGGKPVKKEIRSLAWIVVKWAQDPKTRPDVIFLENVREFADWGPLLPVLECQACQWHGIEGQAKLCRVRRRCPSCNSLRLKQTERMLPDPKRKGLTFRRWVGRLRNLGYQIQWKNLNAADFGPPTHRRRLFLVARCDGKPIVWPQPTHADPKKLDEHPLFDRPKPWRTAAECIDWSIPCVSIFDPEARRAAGMKPVLEENTMRRIAHGVKRYVLENPKPFLVGCGGPAYAGEPRSLDKPFGTVMTKNSSAVVTPILVGVAHGLVTPVVVRIGQTGSTGKYCNGVDEPLTTVTSKQEHCVAAPVLVRCAHGSEGRWGRDGQPLGEPLPTVTASKDFALMSPTLIQVGYGEREGQAPRVPGLDKPLGTVVASGEKHALVAAFIAKHYGGQVGAAVKGSAIEQPLRTITSSGNHAALVYSFLIKYFGTAIGQHVTEPLHTITGKDRFGLVTVTIDGQLYVVVDIGMRMLTPRELARAQGFPDTYVLTGIKSQQVARIGNSVCPMMAKVLVAANLNPEAVHAH